MHCSAGYDQPELAVLAGAGGIAAGWLGTGVGVRMIVADDFQPLTTRGAMLAEQRRRVDLEAGFGMCRNVAGRYCAVDGKGLAAAKQQSTRLARHLACRMGKKLFRNAACNLRDHTDIG